MRPKAIIGSLVVLVSAVVLAFSVPSSAAPLPDGWSRIVVEGVAELQLPPGCRILKPDQPDGTLPYACLHRGGVLLRGTIMFYRSAGATTAAIANEVAAEVGWQARAEDKPGGDNAAVTLDDWDLAHGLQQRLNVQRVPGNEAFTAVAFGGWSESISFMAASWFNVIVNRVYGPQK